jgi:hypothetical protein
VGDWRTVSPSHPLEPQATGARTAHRVVQRAKLRGPETRAVAAGLPGLPGMIAQLGSPRGGAAPDWPSLVQRAGAVAPTETPTSSPAVKTGNWWEGWPK